MREGITKEGITLEKKENEPKKTIVEIGPGGFSLIDKICYGYLKNNKNTYSVNNEEIFQLNPGDHYIGIDLPKDRNREAWDAFTRGRDLKNLQNELNTVLPDNIKGEVLHADAQNIPLKSESVEILFMANVISGHIKDDFDTPGMAIKDRPYNPLALQEKLNIIEEIKRVLKPRGKLIIEEEYAPSYKNIVDETIQTLHQDSDFKLRRIDDDTEGILILELTKLEKK